MNERIRMSRTRYHREVKPIKRQTNIRMPQMAEAISYSKHKDFASKAKKMKERNNVSVP